MVRSSNAPFESRPRCRGLVSAIPLNCELLEDRTVPAFLLANQTVFQQGLDTGFGDYTGTEDTYIAQNSPGTNFGNSNHSLVSGVSGSVNQGLLRFNNMFGPDTIPNNAVIIKATLSLHVSDTAGGGGSGATLHRMNTGWSENTATWNSLSGGVQLGTQAVAKFNSQAGLNSGLPINGPGPVSIDVTFDVEAFRDLGVNNGWALMPPQAASQPNPWGFRSSEFADLASRPQLTVDWFVPENATGVNDVSLGNGTPVEGVQISKEGTFPPNVATILPEHQYLIRFDDLYDPLASTTLPKSPWIYDARLVLTTTPTGGGSGAGIYTLINSFDSDTTWDSFGAPGGVVPGIHSDIAALSKFGANSDLMNIAGDQPVSFNVTSAVIQWTDGTRPNNGFAVLPIGAAGTDAWNFFTNQSGSNRPVLMVTALARPVLEADSYLVETFFEDQHDPDPSEPSDPDPSGPILGKSINAILGGAYTDEDSTSRGIAITNAPSNNGVWQFDLGDGKGWVNINRDPDPNDDDDFWVSIPPGGALLLDASAELRFVPDRHVFGKHSIQFRGWDQFDKSPNGSIITNLGNIAPALSRELRPAFVEILPVADTPEPISVTMDEDVLSTSGLNANRSPVDKAEVTHFQITGIENGNLFLNGSQINDGDFVLIDDVTASSFAFGYGFQFKGAPNYFTDSTQGKTAGFFFRAGIEDPDTGIIELGGLKQKATVVILPVADDPIWLSAPGPVSTFEDTKLTTGLEIMRNPVDGPEVQILRVTNIFGGRVFRPDGSEIPEGGTLQIDNASMGLSFMPGSNFFGPASFNVQAGLNSISTLGGNKVLVSINVLPVADTPFVTNATTNQGEQSKSGLVLIPNPVDTQLGKDSVTFFQITGITNGTLFLNNGTTPVVNNDFVSVVDGKAGLRFTPAPGFFGEGFFFVQAAVGTPLSNAVLGGGIVKATIEVIRQPEPPIITPSILTIPEDTQSKLITIRPDPVDVDLVTHYQIQNVIRGTVFLADGVTAVPQGKFVSIAQADAGLRFTPEADFFGKSSFRVRAATSPQNSDLAGPAVTVTINVTPVADTPMITNSATLPNTQTITGLAIVRNPVDGNEVTHYQITSIQNGQLFRNDGVTPINEGQFITVATGNAGLRFTPAPGFEGIGSFRAQASLSASASGLGGDQALVQIAVGPILNPPSVSATTAREDLLSDEGIVITLNPSDVGSATHYYITGLGSGELFLADGVTPVPNNSFVTIAQGKQGLRYRPFAQTGGVQTFSVQASLGTFPEAATGAASIAEITVFPGASAPVVPTVTIVEDSPEPVLVVILPNPNDGPELTHYRITNVVGGTLRFPDGTPVNDGTFITVAQGQTGLLFQPAPNFFGTATFEAQGSLDTTLDGLGGLTIAEIIVTPVPDAPIVSTVSVAPGQTSAPITITPNPVDGTSVTHFRITGITGGTLSLVGSGAPVVNGQFLTVAEGAAGVVFRPNDGFVGTASFQVQGALSANATGLGGPIVQADIFVGTGVVPPPGPGPGPGGPGTPFIRPAPAQFYVVAADVGGGPVVNVYSVATNQLLTSFFAYDPSFLGGVRVAVGDVTGDGVTDIVTVPGVGGGSQVNVYSGVDFRLLTSFFAYEPTFLGGAYVALADLNGNGRAEIITGTGVGGGPRITIWDGLNGVNLGSFFAYEETFRGGVLVSAGDLDGDGLAEIIAGTGVGGGPRVQVFDGVTFAERASFFAYSSDFRGGVFVDVADVTGDGRAEILTGPGVGGPNNILLFSRDGNLLRNLPVPVPSSTGNLNPGLRVATAEKSPGQVEILVATGSGQPSVIQVFSAGTFEPLGSFDPFPGFEGGVFVG